MALVATLTWYCWGYIPGTLYFDQQSVPHGTGVKKYLYPSGELKIKEHYVNGRLSKSIWFKPNGNILATTNWNKESCIGYYLRDDGSIRVKMQYVNSVAHGKAIYYHEDGTVDKQVEFRNGVEVTH